MLHYYYFNVGTALFEDPVSVRLDNDFVFVLKTIFIHQCKSILKQHYKISLSKFSIHVSDSYDGGSFLSNLGNCELVNFGSLTGSFFIL